jgi:hypothetical protein
MKFQLSATALFLVGHALAQTEGIDIGPGPSQNATLFADANQHPNATGSGVVGGVDTSLDNVGTVPIVWTTSINVTEVPWAPNQTVTNTALTFSEPWMQYPAHQNNTGVWGTCVLIMKHVERNATVKGQSDSGDCFSTFGEECVLELRDAITDAFVEASRKTNSTGTCERMKIPPIPLPCSGSMTFDSVDFSMLSIPLLQVYI